MIFITFSLLSKLLLHLYLISAQNCDADTESQLARGANRAEKAKKAVFASLYIDFREIANLLDLPQSLPISIAPCYYICAPKQRNGFVKVLLLYKYLLESLV